jgi:hypothetical protein
MATEVAKKTRTVCIVSTKEKNYQKIQAHFAV